MSKVYVVVGLGFGDEGKGAITGFLTKKYNSTLTVRFNGGAQAAHAVVLEDGRHHIFSQFGSGTFVPGCRTHLSRHMLVNPIAMQAEARHLIGLGVHDVWSRVTVEASALVTTPWHVALNRLREMSRGKNRHGSCGMGIGETVEDHVAHGGLRVSDVHQGAVYPVCFRKTLQRIRERLKAVADNLPLPDSAEASVELNILNDSEALVGQVVGAMTEWVRRVEVVGYPWLQEELRKNQAIVFEGAQGVLLDENYGFHPHTTWSQTTFAHANGLISGSERDVDVVRIGVLRAYHTRHGAGPFPTEDIEMGQALPEAHNDSAHTYQQGFRVGAFDTVLARYARQVTGPLDMIAVNHLDRVTGRARICTHYEPRRPVNRDNPTRFTEIPASQSLASQEQMGKILTHNIRPVIKNLLSDELVSEVQKATQTPVRCLGYGPRASDKTWLGDS